MKICDCCGQSFVYGPETAKTDGEYKTIKCGSINVRVSVSVKAHNGVDYADICPHCRVMAVEEYLGAPVS